MNSIPLDSSLRIHPEDTVMQSSDQILSPVAEDGFKVPSPPIRRGSPEVVTLLDREDVTEAEQDVADSLVDISTKTLRPLVPAPDKDDVYTSPPIAFSVRARHPDSMTFSEVLGHFVVSTKYCILLASRIHFSGGKAISPKIDKFHLEKFHTGCQRGTLPSYRAWKVLHSFSRKNEMTTHVSFYYIKKIANVLMTPFDPVFEGIRFFLIQALLHLLNALKRQEDSTKYYNAEKRPLFLPKTTPTTKLYDTLISHYRGHPSYNGKTA